MGVGRFICVGIPFVLTLCSLICILISMLNGTTNRSLDMFEVRTQNLSISSSSLINFANSFNNSRRSEILPIELPIEERAVPGDLINLGLNNKGIKDAVNFTASDFGLADKYRVYMWGYCSTTGSNTTCTKAKFDWAHSSINVTYINEEARAKSGTNATLPKDVTGALKTYATVSKWVQVVYIIAFVLTLIELIVGIFGFFSRIGSCVTYIVAGLASTAIIAASGLATSASLVVVLAVNSTSKAYGVKATLKTGFLSITWLACAFSVGAAMFWLFSICCCKNEHRRNQNNGSQEKFIPNTGSSYTPINGNTGYQGQQQGFAMGGVGAARPVKTGAYEPYSHTNV